MATTREDFATVEDLQKYWRSLTDEEEIRAETLINMASSNLRLVAKNNKVDIDALVDDPEDDLYKQSVKAAILSSVKRAMTMPANAPPAEEWSQGASPYSETIKFSNPSTDLYFKTNELRILGLSSVTGKSQFGVLRGVR